MYEICGACLHAKTIHEKHNGYFMYCGSCFKLCEISEYEINHKPSKIIINDQIRIDLN